MKCIKNKKTGDIIRVEDKQAYQMVGLTWDYVSKDIWRESQGLVKETKSTVSVSHDLGGPIEVINEKKKSKKKQVKL